MAQLLDFGMFSVIDTDGSLGVSWTLTTYASGTSTLLSTYPTLADALALTNPNANPITLPADGRFPPMWFNAAAKGVLKNAAGVVKETIDPLAGDVSADFVSPLDYGAAGDGVTNDAAALTSLATANPGRLVFGGGKTYRITSNLAAGLKLLDGAISDSRHVTAQDDYSVIGFGPNALSNYTYIPEVHAASGGRFFASGNHLVALGWGALQANTTGRRNTALGSRSMIGTTTGYYNTAVGAFTLTNQTTGFENTVIGVQAGEGITTGNGNTLGGIGSGNKISTGFWNTGWGWEALAGNSTLACTGSYNVGVGYRALYLIESGTNNTAMGRDAMVSTTSGTDNTAIGAFALQSNVSGNLNTAIGDSALLLATGSNNTAVGASALSAVVGGAQLTALGFQAGLNAIGDDSTFVGYRAGQLTTSGTKNTFLGRSAGAVCTTGANNVAVGYGADVSAIGAANQNSIGYQAACTGDNQVTLGNSSIATLRCQVTTITALSDRRDKVKRKPLGIGLDFIRGVQIQKWVWKIRGGSARNGQVDFGVISQQLDALQTEHEAEFLGLVDKSNPKRWEATPGKLLYPLITAVQELAAQNDALRSTMQELSARLELLDAA